MLYECIECGHKISSDASSCPNCGAGRAGKLAQSRWKGMEAVRLECERDKNEPGWREREKAEREKRMTILKKIALLAVTSIFLNLLLVAMQSFNDTIRYNRSSMSGDQPILDSGAAYYSGMEFSQTFGAPEASFIRFFLENTPAESNCMNLLLRIMGAPKDWGNQLTTEQANKEYGIPSSNGFDGSGLTFDHPLTRLSAITMRNRYGSELTYSWSKAMDNGDTSSSREMLGILARWFGSFFDPISILMLFLLGRWIFRLKSVDI